MIKKLKRCSIIIALLFSNIFANEPYNIPMIRDMLQPYMKFDPRVWKGKITIRTEGSAEEKKDDSNHGNVKTQSYSRKLDEKLVLNVCGTAGYPFYAKDESYNYTDRIKSKKIVDDTKANCGYPPEAQGHNPMYIMKHYTPIIKRPGNSMHHIINKGTYFCPDYLTEPPSATLMLMGNNYYLQAGFNCYLCIKEDDVKITKDACSDGPPKRVASHIEPKPSPTTIAVIRKPGEEKDKWISLPPIPHPVGMIEEGQISKNGDSIIGEKTFPEKSGSHGYKEKTSYAWNLNAEDQCSSIYNFLLSVINSADAYSDSETRKNASNLNNYKEAVDQEICNLTKDCNWSKIVEEGGVSIDFGVNYNCKIEGKEKLKQQKREACEHPVIYEWELKHEEEHIRQCEKNHDKYISNSIVARGQAETSAYLLEAEGLLAWLKESCKDRGLDFETPANKIDEIKGRDACCWEKMP